MTPDSNLPEREPDSLIEATDDVIAHRVASLAKDDTNWTDPRSKPRWSATGNQAKFALARVGDRWFWATYEQPSTHIAADPNQRRAIAKWARGLRLIVPTTTALTAQLRPPSGEDSAR